MYDASTRGDAVKREEMSKWYEKKSGRRKVVGRDVVNRSRSIPRVRWHYWPK